MNDALYKLEADSCLHKSGKAPEDLGDGLSREDAFALAVELDTVSAEAVDAVDGISAPAVYRRYQAQGVTQKYRNKDNIYGICIHTPEGYEPGTLSVLSGTRAGFDAYLPLNGRFYPCNDISRYYTWHSGHSWGNPFTIGIEQGDFASRSGQFGDAHYERLARLCAYYCEIYELKVEHVSGAKPGLMSHASLTPASRTDPGASFRWDQLIDLIRDYMRGSGPPKPTPKPNDEKTLYRVNAGGKQVGAYGEKANALSEIGKQIDRVSEVRLTRSQ